LCCSVFITPALAIVSVMTVICFLGARGPMLFSFSAIVFLLRDGNRLIQQQKQWKIQLLLLSWLIYIDRLGLFSAA
jgi:hypothetical protein